MLFHIDGQLRRPPGTTDEEWVSNWKWLEDDSTTSERLVTIGQNHGIRDRNVSAWTKEAFKKEMPKIIELFPGMMNPFKGHIVLHSVNGRLREAHFVVKP